MKLTREIPPEPVAEAYDDPLFESEIEPAYEAPQRAAPPPPPIPLRPAAPARAGDQDWTWNDLLSDLDTPPAPGQPAAADPVTLVLHEIRDMGIDSHALLPHSRTDEIAAILRGGDTHGARQLVRRLAPAAMRRMSRRVLTEPSLRARVAQFIEGFDVRIDEAALADRTG